MVQMKEQVVQLRVRLVAAAQLQVQQRAVAAAHGWARRQLAQVAVGERKAANGGSEKRRCRQPLAARQPRRDEQQPDGHEELCDERRGAQSGGERDGSHERMQHGGLHRSRAVYGQQSQQAEHAAGQSGNMVGRPKQRSQPAWRAVVVPELQVGIQAHPRQQQPGDRRQHVQPDDAGHQQRNRAAPAQPLDIRQHVQRKVLLAEEQHRDEAVAGPNAAGGERRARVDARQTRGLRAQHVPEVVVMQCRRVAGGGEQRIGRRHTATHRGLDQRQAHRPVLPDGALVEPVSCLHAYQRKQAVGGKRQHGNRDDIGLAAPAQLPPPGGEKRLQHPQHDREDGDAQEAAQRSNRREHPAQQLGQQQGDGQRQRHRPQRTLESGMLAEAVEVSQPSGAVAGEHGKQGKDDGAPTVLQQIQAGGVCHGDLKSWR